MGKYIALLVVLVAAGAAGIFLWSNRPPAAEAPRPAAAGSEAAAGGRELEARNHTHRVTLATNKGEIVFETYDADAPKAAAKFIALAEKGFYNGLTFHRIVKGFVIQGGDPKGNGTGGPGYVFEDELNPDTESGRRGYQKGTVAMANSGPNTNGSQFFITLDDLRPRLPYLYTIFGVVIQGQDIVDAIGNVAVGPADQPLSPVLITSVKVERVEQ